MLFFKLKVLLTEKTMRLYLSYIVNINKRILRGLGVQGSR